MRRSLDPISKTLSVPIPTDAGLPKALGGRLGGLTLRRQVWVLAIWPLLEQVMAFLVGTVDMVLAARLQPEALAIAANDALGVAGYVGWLMGMMMGAVGVGASALVARAIGGRHKRLANAALGQAILLALVVGFAIGLVVFMLARGIAELADEWSGPGALSGLPEDHHDRCSDERGPVRRRGLSARLR